MKEDQFKVWLYSCLLPPGIFVQDRRAPQGVT